MHILAIISCQARLTRLVFIKLYLLHWNTVHAWHYFFTHLTSLSLIPFLVVLNLFYTVYVLETLLSVIKTTVKILSAEQLLTTVKTTCRSSHRTPIYKYSHTYISKISTPSYHSAKWYVIYNWKCSIYQTKVKTINYNTRMHFI